MEEAQSTAAATINDDVFPSENQKTDEADHSYPVCKTAGDSTRYWYNKILASKAYLSKIHVSCRRGIQDCVP